jgi:hypothetical protein
MIKEAEADKERLEKKADGAIEPAATKQEA